LKEAASAYSLPMVEGIVGVAFGAAVGWFFAMRSRAGPAGGPAEETAKAIADLQRAEPTIAAILKARPAVPVADTPAVTTMRQVASDEGLKGCNEDLKRLLRALRGWEPNSPTYGDEAGYADSMRRYLSRSGITRDGNYEMQPPLRLDLKEGTPRKFAPDFVFWSRLLVEVKGDMSRASDSDRSLGQLFRYLLAWKEKGPAVLIICGDCDGILRFIIREYVTTWRERFSMPVTVFFAQHEGAEDVPQVAAGSA
jgi:hypothetical protein